MTNVIVSTADAHIQGQNRCFLQEEEEEGVGFCCFLLQLLKCSTANKNPETVMRFNLKIRKAKLPATDYYLYLSPKWQSRLQESQNETD